MDFKQIIEKYKYCTELHAHSCPVSGCGKFPAEEVVKTYLSTSANTLTITNHLTENQMVGRNASELAEFYLSDYYKA